MQTSPNAPGYFQLTGSNVKDVMLLSGVTATGAGTLQSIGGAKTLRIEVWGTGTFTVQIQANKSNGSATYRNLPIWDNINRGYLASNNIVATGFYDIDIQGYTNVQANVSAISGGNINAAGGLMA